MVRNVFVALIVAVLLVGVVAGTGLAGDGSILIYSEKEEYTVEPGEEVEIHVEVSHHGTTYGLGLEHISLVGEYDDDLLTVTDVEYAGWFESEDADGTLNTETAMDQPGVVNATQLLEGTEEGVTATERYVTLTFEVDPDAASNTTVDFGESSVTIAGGFPSSIFETNPEIIVEGTESGTDSGDDAGSVDAFGAPQIPAAVAAAVALLAVVAFRRR